MDPKQIIDELYKKTGGKFDLCLFCIAYRIGMRVDEGPENVIKLLTESFGHTLWKKTCLVLTMVNTMTNKKQFPSLKTNVEEQLKQYLRNAGVPEDIVRDQCILPAGIGEEPLLLNGKQEDWNNTLFLHCLSKIGNETKMITFTQVRQGINIWRVIAFGTGLGAVGAATTTGTKIGASVGLAGGSIGVAAGAIAGGMVGAAGGWLINALKKHLS